MIIGIDIDGTVNTLPEAVLEIYNERHGTNYTVDDIHTYRIEDNIPCDPDEIKNMFLDKEVWKRVKVIPEAVEYIKKLYEDDHKIYFVSATLLDNVPKKASWLRRNFSFLNIESCFIPIKDKHLLDLDLLIDDCTDNLRKWQRYKGIVYDRPWNQDCKSPRAKSWEEIYNMMPRSNELG